MDGAEEPLVTNMKRYKIIKVVYAKNLKAALKAEKKVEPARAELDEEISEPNIAEPNIIGFRKSTRNGSNGRK